MTTVTDSWTGLAECHLQLSEFLHVGRADKDDVGLQVCVTQDLQGLSTKTAWNMTIMLALTTSLQMYWTFQRYFETEVFKS